MNGFQKKEKKERSYFLNIYMVIFLFLSVGVWIFERAQMPRTIYLLGGILTHFVLCILLSFVDSKKSEKYSTVLFFLMTVNLILLRYVSKFAINYFLILMQYLLMFAIGFFLPNKKGMVLQIIHIGFLLFVFFEVTQNTVQTLYVIQGVNFLLMGGLVMVLSFFTSKTLKEQREKNLLYKELLDAHRELKWYAEQVEELSLYRERQRIAREVHDTLGHRLTGVMMQLEVLKRMGEKEQKEIAENAYESAKEALKEVRMLVSTLSQVIRPQMEDIRELIENSQKVGNMEILLEEVILVPLEEEQLRLFFYTTREMLTNAQRHARARHVSIQIQNTAEQIRFCFINDGDVPKDIKEGFGLQSLKKDAKGLQMEFSISLENGFCLEMKKEKI